MPPWLKNRSLIFTNSEYRAVIRCGDINYKNAITDTY